MVSGPSISRERASIRMFLCKIGSKIGTTHCDARKQPHNANGVTPNTVIDSNDEPAGNNQQRMVGRGY